MDSEKEIARLRKQIDDARNGNPENLSAWKQRTAAALRISLGEDHPSYKAFNGVNYTLSIWSNSTPQSAFEAARRRGVLSAIAILDGAIYELEERSGTSAKVEVRTDKTDDTKEPGEIFIVHGHDHGRLAEVKNAVVSLMGRPAVVLHEQANLGQTIIEKFEKNAARAGFAIVLLTADDQGKASGGGTDRARARQNVVFEAGYFVGRLTRRNVVLLYEEGVELPSDLNGVVYERLDSERLWRYKLGQELRSAGFAADLHNL